MNDFNKWYNDILIDADLIDKRYPIKGMPIIKPNGLYIHNTIMKYIENEWDRQEIEKMQFPLLIPKKFIEKEREHIKGFNDEVFWINQNNNEKNSEKNSESIRALRPTSETAIYHMFSLWLQSYQDLPLKIYQSCAVYRNETKHTIPLIRAREIYWNETHTCHIDKKSAIDNLETAWSSYYKVLSHFGIFGLRIRRPIWDTFPGAVHTDVMDTILPSGKALQIIGAHYLGDKFAKPFDITFLNNNGEKKYPMMACYGVSTRLMASCISAHGDKYGLVLPSTLAKYKIVITTIYHKDIDNQLIIDYCQKLYDELSIKYRVKLDLSNETPGKKYYHYDKIGIPIRIDIGIKEVKNNNVCIKIRNKKNKLFVSINEMDIQKYLIDYDEELRMKAKKYQENMVTFCTNLNEIKNVIEKKGGFVKIPFYSLNSGENEDKIINVLCHAEIRGFSINEKVKNNELCAITNKKAHVYAYIAKAY